MSESSRRDSLDRFRALEAEGGVPLDANAPLQVGGAEELPFRRCAVCGMDAHRSARRCEMCGADLRSAQQERFNRELQRKLREQDAALARAAEELAKRQARAVEQERGYRSSALGTLSRPAGAPPPGLGSDDLTDLLRKGGTRRAVAEIALSLALQAIRAVPSAVWLGLAGLLLAGVAYLKIHGGFGMRQLLLAGVLLVPVVGGIVLGRPLRRTDGAQRMPPGRSRS